MIAPGDALRVALKTVKSLKPVQVPLARALGRCLDALGPCGASGDAPGPAGVAWS